MLQRNGAVIGALWVLVLAGVAPAGLHGQAPAPPSLCLRVVPPDYRLECFPRAFAPGQRPLVLALGGGGAKGIAHVGVLQRLQEEGLPVAGVAGTSMGAFMGAMYAAGYSGFAIQALLEKVDMGALLLDREHRYPGETLREQENERNALFSLEFKPGSGFAFAAGSDSGHDLNRVLKILLSRGSYPAGDGFDGLRVPFRAVSSDLQTGRASAPARGDLATVVQASMSIPGLFTPVLRDGDQQVDGMLVQNLPVETARSLDPGAAVMAVEVGSSLEAALERSMLGLALRALDVSIEQRTEISRQAADLLVRPRTEKITYLDFHQQVASAVAEGRRAFDERLDALEEILYGPEGRAPAPSGRLAVQAPPWLQARITALAEASLPPGPRLRRHYLRLLRRIQAAGLARQAVLRFTDAGPVLVAEPYPWIRQIAVQAPADWLDLARQLLAGAHLQTGAVFNPVDLGRAMDTLLLLATFRGRPLLSVEGTTFDADQGVLRLVIKEPLVTSIRVRSGCISPAQTAAVANLLAPFVGRPLDARPISLTRLLVEKQLGLEELRVEPDPDRPRVAFLVTPVPDQRTLVDGVLAYESTWAAHGSVSVRQNRLLGSDFNLGLQVSGDRLRRAATLELSRVLESWPRLGWSLSAATTDDRFLAESLQAPFPTTALAASLVGRSLQERRLGLELVAHMGMEDRGAVSLAFNRRWSDLDPALPAALPRVDELQVNGEWDSFDRYLFPTQGDLFRIKLGQGWLAAPDPQTGDGSYHFAYSRTRALWPLGAWASLEGDLEAGLGWNLPLSRWYRVGGPSFLAGTPSSAFRVPNVALSRVGLPMRVVQVLNVNFQVIPRLDAGYLGGSEPGQLRDNGLVRGLGLSLRSELGRWFCELALGRWFATGTGRAERAQVNVLLGTHPMDLWREP